jgi:hypothetical protein
MLCRFVTIAIFAFYFSTAFADLPGARTQYFAGEARVLTLRSGVTLTQTVLLAKKYDPANSTLSEIACYKTGASVPELLPVYMKVSNDQLTVSDSPDFKSRILTGTGSVQGTAWDWEFLKFSMDFGPDVHIEDVNFSVRNQLIARKQIFYKGSPVQLWEVEANLISMPEFQKKRAEMNCPQFE